MKKTSTPRLTAQLDASFQEMLQDPEIQAVLDEELSIAPRKRFRGAAVIDPSSSLEDIPVAFDFPPAMYWTPTIDWGKSLDWSNAMHSRIHIVHVRNKEPCPPS